MRAIVVVLVCTASASAQPVDTGTEEVIVIHDHPRPVQMPKQVGRDPALLAPYSDRAALSDRWTRAWLMLDVDEHGVVARAKFLKRPGLDLDPIALDRAFSQSFEPARDAWNKPTRAYVVYAIEWPSYGWLAERFGNTIRMPGRDGEPSFWGELLPKWPPCAGSGPLVLDSIHPVYRDCSVPDLSHADASEPWYRHPAR